jgi:hypothetical protein
MLDVPRAQQHRKDVVVANLRSEDAMLSLHETAANAMNAAAQLVNSSLRARPVKLLLDAMDADPIFRDLCGGWETTR